MPGEALSDWDRLKMNGVIDVDIDNDEAVLPYEAQARYSKGEPLSTIRCGAYLGWPNMMNAGSLLTVLADRLDQLSVSDRACLRLVCIDHQASGHHCSHPVFVARQVRLTPRMIPFATTLCARFYHAENGHFAGGETRGLAAQFDADIRAAGLSLYDYSDSSRECPVEAVYPISATAANIAMLIADHHIVMRQLAPLFTSPILRKELVILILAENSD